MRCMCYRVDLPELVAALTDPTMLLRYQDALAVDLGSLADRALITHLRRLTTLASRVLGEGFESVARAELVSADELLSDVLAVATFHGWEVPLQPLGEQNLACGDLPRGLLGADANPESARVWLIDGSTIALCRAREAGEVADWSGHPRA